MQQESTCRLPNGTTKDENDKPDVTVPQERVDLLLNSLIATATPEFDSYCNFGHRVDVLWVVLT
jgi:hypothetical protein